MNRTGAPEGYETRLVHPELRRFTPDESAPPIAIETAPDFPPILAIDYKDGPHICLPTISKSDLQVWAEKSENRGEKLPSIYIDGVKFSPDEGGSRHSINFDSMPDLITLTMSAES